jgi:hypothetical protein
MSVVIDIAAQFTGKRAFAQAESAADKLGRNVKRALIGVGVTAFAKSAITAFAQNEKQLQLFNNSLQNIGFGFATKESKAFLDSLELQFGVVGDQLVPAYQQLITTTRSLGAAQNLTNLALDIAARQGISVTQAADALSKAYLGNTKGINSLGLGISKATLASGNFALIIKEIAKITKGSAAQGADTLAGKMARLSIAADKAREAIGAGLVAALMAITDTTDIEELQKKIISFGESTARSLAQIGKLIEDNITLIKIFGAAFLAGLAVTKVAAFIMAVQSIVKAVTVLRNTAIAASIASMFMLNPLGAAVMAAGMLATIGLVIKGVDLLIDRANTAGKTISNLDDPSDRGRERRGNEAAAAKAAKDAKAAAAAQLKATLASTKAVRDQAKLKKAQGILDIDQIQIMAALQGKLTETERTRLELQLALLQENASEADRLGRKVFAAQLLTTELGMVLKNLPEALNPFAKWAEYANSAKKVVAEVATALTPGQSVAFGLGVSPGSIGAGGTIIGSALPDNPTIPLPYSSQDFDMLSPEARALFTGFGQSSTNINYTYNVSGATQGLLDELNNGLINNSASGIRSSINRTNFVAQ